MYHCESTNGCNTALIASCNASCDAVSTFSCKCLEDKNGHGSCAVCHTGKINFYCFKTLLTIKIKEQNLNLLEAECALISMNVKRVNIVALQTKCA